MRNVKFSGVRGSAGGVGRFVALVVLLLTFSLLVHAEQVFDHVKNPTASDVSNFRGLSTDQISTTTRAKTGHFFMETTIKDTTCATRNMTLGSITIIEGMNVKGYQNCYNVSPTIQVRISVDNPDYGLTQFARVGDFDNGTKHVSVVPYSFNVWKGTGTSSSNAATLFGKLVVAQDRNPQLKKRDLTKPGDIGNWWLDEGSFYPYYEWKINRKSGVCSSEVLSALNAKSIYYTNPSELAITGFGTVTASNCRTLMFPSSTSSTIDRVNSMLDDDPEVFHSLYYSDDYDYLGYPFVIKDVQLTCYANGKVVGGSKLTEKLNRAITQTSPELFFIPYLSSESQKYAWSSSRGGYGVYSPGNLELLSVDYSVRCPAGTNFYTASAVIAKNPMYRQKSPVDYTWYWRNIFNITSGSAFDATLQSSSQDQATAILLTQTGDVSINATQTPANHTYNQNQNQDKNKISESGSTKYSTGSTSYGRESSTTSAIGSSCIECEQNITGYGGNGTGANSGAGVVAGGSFIGTGVDDSAVSDLMLQAVGESRIEQKAKFMEKLVQLGSLVLSAVIILYSIFALFAIILVFFMFIRLPSKMKESLKELMDAGTRK